MRRPFGTVFSQALELVLACVVATLALGLGVVAFSPTPPPPTVSVADYVDALRSGADADFSRGVSATAPELWTRSKGQAEALIAASLARGIGARAGDVKVAITAPALYGLLPRSGGEERGHITIIDIPKPVKLASQAGRFDISGFLLRKDVRVPPFVAMIRQADGRYLQLQPSEQWPSAWQLRLVAIFALALLAVAPLAWFGARRWTNPIRNLAERVHRFDGEDAGPPVTRADDALEVRALEAAFEAMHARIRAQIAERMQMLMAVAHDLRTPLTSLRIRVEDVRDPLRAGFLRDVSRMDRMIEGILAFARAQTQPGDTALVDFRALVQELVHEATARGEAVSLQAEPAYVRGNADDLARAIENILSNAARYASRASVKLATDGEHAELSVTDNGPGVPETSLPRLTEPFFRVEGSRSIDTGGTGLGLATVRAIAEAHCGTVSFANTAPGFEVKITLPVVNAPVAGLRSGPTDLALSEPPATVEPVNRPPDSLPVQETAARQSVVRGEGRPPAAPRGPVSR